MIYTRRQYEGLRGLENIIKHCCMHNAKFKDDTSQRIAFYHPSLECGGTERVMVMLVNGFAERGYLVDLVLVSSAGPFRKEIAAAVNVVDLKAISKKSALK